MAHKPIAYRNNDTTFQKLVLLGFPVSHLGFFWLLVILGFLCAVKCAVAGSLIATCV